LYSFVLIHNIAGLAHLSIFFCVLSGLLSEKLRGTEKLKLMWTLP